MQESATVLSCADGIALVRIERSAACDGCDLCTFSERAHAMTARAIDRLGVSPGDRVMITAAYNGTTFTARSIAAN